VTSGPEPDRRWILLTRTIVVLHRVLERVAQAHALTVAQYRFLLMLKLGPRRASELASLSGIGRPTASVLVNALEKRGMVERYADPDDGRAEMLRLTSSGLAEYAAFERELAGELATYLDMPDSEPLLACTEELAHLIDRKRQRPVPD